RGAKKSVTASTPIVQPDENKTRPSRSNARKSYAEFPEVVEEEDIVKPRSNRRNTTATHAKTPTKPVAKESKPARSKRAVQSKKVTFEDIPENDEVAAVSPPTTSGRSKRASTRATTPAKSTSRASRGKKLAVES